MVNQNSNLHCILNVGTGNREFIYVHIVKAYMGAEVLLHSFFKVGFVWKSTGSCEVVHVIGLCILHVL